ncbi:transposase [Halospina denitrificans]|uniref:Transposase n=1 Tax=Halospina denitrificans TaxID=332522 RepID=A0A4R7JYJ5_9GAMM|nr:IS21 family transposase [Halospina denitrificans]TDT43592.1 transposase [Halospina denitrificans]
MLKRTDAMMIKRMRRQGLYLKDIAAQIGCSERTVRRTLQRGGPASGRRPGARGSKLDPYKPMIDAMLGDGIWNCRVIRTRLQAAGYDGGSTLVEDYVRPLRRLQPSKATVRFETPPGRQLQHDWGEIDAEVDGQTQRVHFAVNTLGHSRYFHVYAAPCQDAEHTYESLVRAFEHFGGVAAEVLVDNQRAAVVGRSGGDVRFNARFLDLAGCYGFKPRACRPYRARTKGKTERMVRYVKENFFQRHQRFDSLDHLNHCLEQWLAEVANQREHGTHGDVVMERFRREEAPALQPLPQARFDTAYRFQRTAGWDGYINVEGNRYSVPDEYCGEVLNCHLTLEGVLTVYGRLRLQGPDEPIARHVLSDPSAGWQQQPEHHQRLWRESMPVQVRDLSVYEEMV